MFRFPCPAILLIVLLTGALAACSSDSGSSCDVPLSECKSIPGCASIDCDGCNGYAPNRYCQSDDILSEIDPCGSGCVEPCTMLDEKECVAGAAAGCQVGACTDCDGNEVFAGCYQVTAPSCPDLACP